MKFSRHNVILPDGSESAPGRPVLVQSPPFQSLVRLLDFIFPGESPQNIHIADLGCMEGGISIELARLGYTVTGIEARERHIERCEYLLEQFSAHSKNSTSLSHANVIASRAKQSPTYGRDCFVGPNPPRNDKTEAPLEVPFNLKGVRFFHDRVEHLEQHGSFDFVFASGILYHLENPVSFIEMLHRATRRAVLLNTHFAEERIPSRFRHKLAQMTTHEGRKGRWYAEWPKGTSPEEIAAQERTAVGNRRSFWLRKDELLEVVRASGFDLVFELFDGHYTMEKAFTAMRRNSRGTFVGIKNSGLNTGAKSEHS